MLLAQKYCNFLLLTLSIPLFTFSKNVLPVTLNFSAVLTDATCSIGLDRSTLPLGEVSLRKLKTNSLISVQPFTLYIHECSGVDARVPTIIISGAGELRDNKWIFRNSNSSSSAGIIVMQNDSLPNYNDVEVRDGTSLNLGGSGAQPIDQSINFYAGVSCGGVNSCREIKTGTISATLFFTFEYK